MATKKKTVSKSKGKGGVIVTIIALFIAAVVTVCAIGSSGFANANVKTWFNSWGKGSKTAEKEATSFLISTESSDETKIRMNVVQTSTPASVSEETPKQATARKVNGKAKAAAASGTSTSTMKTSYTLAIVTDPYVADDQFTWEISDEEHVTLSVAADTRSATVTCVEAFGEQIIITSTSMHDPEMYATCKADYVKRCNGNATVSVTGGNGNSITFTNNGSIAHTAVVTPEYGVGTITPEIEITQFTVGCKNVYVQYENMETGESASVYGSTLAVTTPFNMFAAPLDDDCDLDPTKAEEFNKEFKKATTNSTSDGYMNVRFKIVYNGVVFYEGDIRNVGVAFDISNIATWASGVQLGPDIVF